MLLTVGKVAEMIGITRTALLYYDEIGLVKPSERSKKGYRLYNNSDLNLLKQVRIYRQAGISLDDIPGLLSNGENDIAAALLKRLEELNQEIIKIKAQQEVVIRIIQTRSLLRGKYTGDKIRWENILNSAGIDDDTSAKLHADFETHSPELHQRLLEALGFSDTEIHEIRKQANVFYTGRRDE